jgi:UDP-N-acetylglucosamine--N-acetylmuramyl-(pentapeptide) pyrophosphoryl-undecaprenol N-acetylglucosamine transferase
LGVPTAVLEQNARVGMTNRLLAPVVGRAYVSFAETASTFLASRVRVPGNPVRRAFVDAARRAAMDPDGFEARARRVLVLGGSQGARALNTIVPDALARAGLADRGVSVLHQTGPAMRDEVEAAYRALGVDAEVVTFIDDMAAAYASAALVVARAGATTVAELCAVGRPSILVPYPFAADDHQADNALALERAGAARCIREGALDAGSLATAIAGLLDDDEKRSAMAEAAREAGRPDAAAAIVDDLCAWLGCENATSETDADGASGGAGGSEPPPGGPMRRSSVPGRVPYVPGTISARRSGAPPSPRPALVVGWEV